MARADLVMARVRFIHPLGAPARHGIPTVIVHDDPMIVPQVLDTGAPGFVLKPAVATDPVPAVQKVLGGEGLHIGSARRSPRGVDRVPHWVLR